MKNEQQQVKDFMALAMQPCPERPQIPDMQTCLLRISLIQEELEELAEGFAEENIVKAYDAILDLLVVVIGTGVSMGVDLEPGWQEVHRSNMTKFIDGYRRGDGKWMKGSSYSPANLQPIIEAQSNV